MYRTTILALPCLVAGVFASTKNVTMKGSFSNFRAESMKPESNTIENLYESCTELDQDGELVSMGRGCVATLLLNTYQVLVAATEVQQPVDVVHNDTVFDQRQSVGKHSTTAATGLSQSNVATIASSLRSTATLTTSSSHSIVSGTYDAKLKRQSDLANSMLLESMNDRLSQQLGGRHAIRALDIGESDLHPKDGIAIRTNVHGDDAVLHVHTNGSHATAEFKKDATLRMMRRDQDLAKAHNFRFSEGAFGIKMQVNKINRANASTSDMNAYWNAFGYGNGEIDPAPAFTNSDSWKFIVCGVDGWTQLIAGKVIVLEGPSDYGYEPYEESIACE